MPKTKLLLKVVESRETLFIIALVVISLVISILDFLGVWTVSSWVSNQIPTITLVLLSLALGSLAIVQVRVIALWERVEEALSGAVAENIRKAPNYVDSNLQAVFGVYCEEIVEDLANIVDEKTIRFEDKDKFKHYYKLTLQTYPKATFLATSRPNSYYLWKGKSVLERNKAD